MASVSQYDRGGGDRSIVVCGGFNQNHYPTAFCEELPIDASGLPAASSWRYFAPLPFTMTHACMLQVNKKVRFVSNVILQVAFCLAVVPYWRVHLRTSVHEQRVRRGQWTVAVGGASSSDALFAKLHSAQLPRPRVWWRCSHWSAFGLLLRTCKSSCRTCPSSVTCSTAIHALPHSLYLLLMSVQQCLRTEVRPIVTLLWVHNARRTRLHVRRHCMSRYGIGKLHRNLFGADARLVAGRVAVIPCAFGRGDERFTICSARL